MRARNQAVGIAGLWLTTAALAGWLLLGARPAAAQPVEYHHPELEWQTTELEHCVIHVHQGLEELGAVAAQIMEDVWDPVTTLYDYTPDTRIHLIFYDTDDYSNGGAYFYNNKIIIWATSLDFDLRGQHNWLRNVLTHEFTHIIQLGAARKFSRQLPFAYLQVMGYEPEKRGDVVQGFPNRVGSWPLPGTMVPAWFAEGTAQYMTEGHRYDFWDSHRDMVLRDRVVQGSLYDLDEMASFDKSTAGSESVYNQGFSFVTWLARRHGDKVLRDLSLELARPSRVSMSTAMQRVLGTDGRDLWAQWKAELEQGYREQLAGVTGNEVAGRLISNEARLAKTGSGGDEHSEELKAPRALRTPRDLGSRLAAGFEFSCCTALGELDAFPEPADELGPTNNLYARISPDGRHVYYASNGESDYLGTTDLWRRDRVNGGTEKVLANIRGSFSLAPDGKSVIFSRTSPADKNGSHYKDLYQYWFAEKLTRRLSEGARLTQPDLSPDGRRIVCVQNGGGSTWLALMDMDSLDGPAWKELGKRGRKKAAKLVPRTLTRDAYGTQVTQPRWSPDGSMIVCARAWGHGRDIVQVIPESGASKELLATAQDERQPQFSPDGQWLLFAQDQGGIFNIHRLHLGDGRSEVLTRVSGGAFMPVAHGDTLYYSGYCDEGFRLYELAGLKGLESQPEPRPDYLAAIPALTREDLDPTVREWSPLKTEFEKPFLIPRLMVDDGELKPGLYFLNMDVFESVQLTGSIAAARLNNLDLFASASAELGRSTAFLELYGMTRDHDSRFDDTFVIIGEEDGSPIYDQYTVQYRFNLAEGHLGLRRRLSDALTCEAALNLNKYKASYQRGASTVNYDYYKGRGLRFRLDYLVDQGNQVDQFINPRGRRWARLEVRQHWDRLIDGFAVSSAGMLEEVYSPANFLEGEVAAGRSWAMPLLPSLSLTLDAKAAVVGKPGIDDFFYTYAGGLLGLRGYSYYSLGGERKALGHLRVGFPIIRRTGIPLGPFHFKRLYGSAFYGAGDAWAGRSGAFDLKQETGVDLKFFMTSWAMMPTALTLGAAYGLDEFRVPELDPGETYGREWRWYATLLFDFDAFQERAE